MGSVPLYPFTSPWSLWIFQQCLILLFPVISLWAAVISVIKSLMKSLAMKYLVQSQQIVYGVNMSQAARGLHYVVIWKQEK